MIKKIWLRRRWALPAAVIVLMAGVVGWRSVPMWTRPVPAATDDLKALRAQGRAALRRDPGDIGAAMVLGQTQLALGDPVAAEHSLRRAASLGGDAVSLHLLLGQALLAQNRPRDLLRELAPLGPPAAQAAMLVLRAEALLALGDRAAAAVVGREAGGMAPGLVDVPVLLGQVALAGGDIETAMREAARALAMDGRAPTALLLKGQIYVAVDDRARALDAFDAVLALQPGLLPARLARARLRLLADDPARGGEDIDAALARDPANVEALYLDAIRLSNLGVDEAAEAMLTRLGDQVARFGHGFYLLALVKSRLKQPEQAWDAVNRQLWRHPSEPDGLALYARLAEQLAAAGNPAAQRALASLAIAARAYPAARLRLEALLATLPDDAAAMNDLAFVYQQLGDPRGLATARRAYAMQASSQAADTLGWILASSAQTAEALPLLQAASAARPAAPGPRYHLAAALAAAGQREAARSAVASALAHGDFAERAAAEQLAREVAKPDASRDTAQVESRRRE